MQLFSLKRTVPGAAFALVLAAAPVAAQDDGRRNFFAGKTITITVGYPDGGPAAAAASFYVRHLGRFIPGEPRIQLQFNPGQNGVAAAIQVGAESPRDGTALGMVGGKAIWSNILEASKLPFDLRRLNWIGSKSQDNVVCAAWHEAGAQSLDEVRRRDLRIGITQPGTRSFVYAKLLNDLAATRFVPVPGFENVDAIMRALEERKVDGVCGVTLEALRLRNPQWLDQGKLKVLVQFARNADEEYRDAPLAYRVPRTDTGRRVMVFLASDAFLNQALFAPQDVPAERVETLRKAFDAMWQDEAVREEAAQQRIAVDPVPGSSLQDFAAQLHGAPQDVLWIVKGVIEAK